MVSNSPYSRVYWGNRRVFFTPQHLCTNQPKKARHTIAMQFLGFHFIPVPQPQGVLGVKLSIEKQVTPSLFKQKASAGRIPGAVQEGVSVLVVETSEVRTAAAGLHEVDLGWAGARRRGALQCSLHCCASHGQLDTLLGLCMVWTLR